MTTKKKKGNEKFNVPMEKFDVPDEIHDKLWGQRNKI